MSDQSATIKMLIEDFHAAVLPAHLQRMVDRDLDLGKPFEPAPGNLVKVVVGMRRSGKTYRLFQQIRDLLDFGVSPDRICYFNFDDDRLRGILRRGASSIRRRRPCTLRAPRRRCCPPMWRRSFAVVRLPTSCFHSASASMHVSMESTAAGRLSVHTARKARRL